MSAYVYLDGPTDDQPAVRYYPETGEIAGTPVLVVTIGRGSVHLDPESARKLAEDILAALPRDGAA